MEIENIFENTLLASKMEKIISNPGLQHLAEEVHPNLVIVNEPVRPLLFTISNNSLYSRT